MAYRTLSVAALLVGVASGVQAGQPTPLRLLGEDARGVATVGLDPQAYEALKPMAAVEIDGLVLGAGRTADVTLTRLEIFTPDVKFINVTDAGEVELPVPDVQVWGGTVAGEPDSRVFLALSPMGSSGYIERGMSKYIISSGPSGNWPTVAYDLASPAGQGIHFEPLVCGGAILPEGEEMPEAAGPQTYGSRVYNCKRYRLAFDCDQEFSTGLFVTAASAQAYVTSLVGAVAEIYQRDMNVTLQVAYLRTWTTTDPYTSASTSDQLTQFRSYWNTNMGSVSRNLAHMLSGRNLGGGIAYLRAACSGSNGYGVSANMDGSFPYPIADHSSRNWDLMVVTHELGHNLGSGHTHDPNSYNPIIDGCGSSPQDCTLAWGGTIMSYCHLCSGGMANMVMTFGPRPIAAIRSYLDGTANGCGTTFQPTTVSQQPADVAVNEGQTITLTVQSTGQAPSAYAWKREGTLVTNGGRISGATTNVLTITGVLPGDEGAYKAELTAPCGVVVSNTADVTVTACPSFTQQPSGAEATVGGSVTITAYSTGAFPRTYQWLKNGSPVSNSERVVGATNFSLGINPVIESDAGTYTLVVSNSCGTRTSGPAVLTVTAPPGCGTSDYNGDGDFGTDADIEAFFACLGGTCCQACFSGGSDFNGDGDFGTDGDIESFFRVLGGGNC